MASTCISSCTDNVDGRALVPRASYATLYKWPESDAEFIRSMSSDSGGGGGSAARAVDSVLCRQMYLRSYTFSRNQTLSERTKKWFDKVRILVTKSKDTGMTRLMATSRVAIINMKTAVFSCSVLWDVFRRLLACTTKVDAVEHGDF